MNTYLNTHDSHLAICDTHLYLRRRLKESGRLKGRPLNLLTRMSSAHSLFIRPSLSTPRPLPPNTQKTDLTWKALTSSPSQIPRPTCPAVNPGNIEIPLREEIPALFRIDERKVSVNDALPAAPDGGCRVRSGAVRRVKEGGPFLRDERTRAGKAGIGEKREHMNAVDIFEVGAKVGGCVDFVFEELGGGWLISC